MKKLAAALLTAATIAVVIGRWWPRPPSMAHTSESQPVDLQSLLHLYEIERNDNSSAANTIVALSVLSLTYYITTVAYFAGGDGQKILEGHRWFAFALPLPPGALFSWILLFAVFENLRRKYLERLESRIFEGLGDESGHILPGNSHIGAAVWTPGLCPPVRLLTTCLSVVLYGFLYLSFVGYIVFAFMLARTHFLSQLPWMMFLYLLLVLGGLSALVASLSRPTSYIDDTVPAKPAPASVS